MNDPPTASVVFAGVPPSRRLNMNHPPTASVVFANVAPSRRLNMNHPPTASVAFANVAPSRRLNMNHPPTASVVFATLVRIKHPPYSSREVSRRLFMVMDNNAPRELSLPSIFAGLSIAAVKLSK